MPLLTALQNRDRSCSFKTWRDSKDCMRSLQAYAAPFQTQLRRRCRLNVTLRNKLAQTGSHRLAAGCYCVGAGKP